MRRNTFASVQNDPRIHKHRESIYVGGSLYKEMLGLEAAAYQANIVVGSLVVTTTLCGSQCLLLKQK